MRGSRQAPLDGTGTAGPDLGAVDGLAGVYVPPIAPEAGPGPAAAGANLGDESALPALEPLLGGAGADAIGPDDTDGAAVLWCRVRAVEGAGVAARGRFSPAFAPIVAPNGTAVLARWGPVLCCFLAVGALGKAPSGPPCLCFFVLFQIPTPSFRVVGLCAGRGRLLVPRACARVVLDTLLSLASPAPFSRAPATIARPDPVGSPPPRRGR